MNETIENALSDNKVDQAEVAEITMALMGNKAYDILKLVALYIIPTLSTAWFIISSAWDIPFQGQILGALATTATVIGVFLGNASMNYKLATKS